MNSGKDRLKEGKLPPGIHRISREAIPAKQGEEFIAPEATPSRDLHDIPCARCGKERADWTGPGVEKDGQFYCSEECARGER